MVAHTLLDHTSSNRHNAKLLACKQTRNSEAKKKILTKQLRRKNTNKSITENDLTDLVTADESERQKQLSYYGERTNKLINDMIHIHTIVCVRVCVYNANVSVIV